jgi:hypothetical protein
MAGRDLIPEAIGAVIEGVCVYGEGEAPIAGFATGAVLRYLLGRQDTARGTLRSQLERSGVTAADFKDTEQLAAAALRYMRAARDQAADENLRVLAQAMVGLARRYELWASDFLRYAEILAPLSRDELILIGTLMKEDQEFYTTPRPPKAARASGRLCATT